MDQSQWSKALQEAIAGKLSIAPDAVTIKSTKAYTQDRFAEPDYKTIFFSVTTAALYLAGLLPPPALESKQQEGESVKVRLSTLKKMTAKTSEKVKQVCDATCAVCIGPNCVVVVVVAFLAS